MIIELDKSLTMPIYTPESARKAGLTETEIAAVFSQESSGVAASAGVVNPFLQSEIRKKRYTTLKELLCILVKLNNRS